MLHKVRGAAEVVVVAAAAQAHVAAVVLALHVREELVGAVEAQRAPRRPPLLAELAGGVRLHVCNELLWAPRLQLQGKGAPLLKDRGRLSGLGV